jgi:hypothetical protein
MTPEEKERIHYEIKAKKEQFDYELQTALKEKQEKTIGCLSDFLFAFWIVVIFSAIVNSCINS